MRLRKNSNDRVSTDYVTKMSIGPPNDSCCPVCYGEIDYSPCEHKDIVGCECGYTSCLICREAEKLKKEPTNV